MRFSVSAIVGILALTGVAHAQTLAPPAGQATAPNKGYVEAVAQSAFGNVTSQSYGGEFGVTMRPNIQVFAEFGQTRNVATAELSTAAQTVAGGMSQTQSNVGYSVKEPVTFGAAGIRYLIPMQSGKAMPYVMVGGGMAKVEAKTAFTVGGTDVTSNIQQYGVVLGTDVAGSSTKPLITFGGGVGYPIWQQVVLDFQFRYGRIFAEDQGINVTRAGIGVGVRF
jgi:opacity protein-like surface antigen